MKTLKFKTNINCGGCIAKVTPSLNSTPGIDKWEVDITNPRKVLTVTSSGAEEGEIVSVLKKVGYNAELLSE
jgi:copper chaperone